MQTSHSTQPQHNQVMQSRPTCCYGNIRNGDEQTHEVFAFVRRNRCAKDQNTHLAADFHLQQNQEQQPHRPPLHQLPPHESNAQLSTTKQPAMSLKRPAPPNAVNNPNPKIGRYSI
jgi:hypothetical protein